MTIGEVPDGGDQARPFAVFAQDDVIAAFQRHEFGVGNGRGGFRGRRGSDAGSGNGPFMVPAGLGLTFAARDNRYSCDLTELRSNWAAPRAALIPS